MKRLWKLEAVAVVVFAATFAGCTGGQETTAETLTNADGSPAVSAAPAVDPGAELQKISGAIPVYAGATFRQDLSQRDATLMQRQYGGETRIYTLATADSFPQVWHYYVTYLAQFRGFDPPDPYPPQNRDFRTFEVVLNDAMKDPFIPGDTLEPQDQRVTLQLLETEPHGQTVIRYIVAPAAPAAPVTTVAETGTTVEAQTGGIVRRAAPVTAPPAGDAGAGDAAEAR